MISRGSLWFVALFVIGCIHPRPATTSVETVEEAPEGALRIGTVIAPCGAELTRVAEKQGADYMIIHRWNGHGASGGCHAELFATH